MNRNRQPSAQVTPERQSREPLGAAANEPRGFFSCGLQRAALTLLGIIGTAGLLLLAGCPADLENPERFMGASAAAGNPGAGGAGTPVGGSMLDTTCLAQAFSAKCSQSFCHAAATAMVPSAGGLDLASPGVADRLINVMASHKDGGSTCPPAKLVDTASPAMSWLLVKINGMQGACGSMMPIGPDLSPDEKTCINTFVTAAASAASTGMPGAAGTTSVTSGGASGATAGSGGT